MKGSGKQGENGKNIIKQEKESRKKTTRKRMKIKRKKERRK